MVLRRGKPLKGFAGDDSSSDSDDNFAAISAKKKKSGQKRPRSSSSGLDGAVEDTTSATDENIADIGDNNNATGPSPILPSTETSSNKRHHHANSTTSATDENIADIGDNNNATGPSPILPSTETSSNKRHHHANSARQAKMDALLHELQSTKPSDPAATSQMMDEDYGSIYAHEASFHGEGYERRPPPQKLGSYVEPGQEHLTTNIFVGNLDPTTTEEELTDKFREFGDLYSVKIMWPRTSEELARNRNTGFVCFMSRKDAEDAVDALMDADIFGNGRRIVLRWGKNVKKTVKFGVGVPSNMRKKPRTSSTSAQEEANNDEPVESRQSYSLEENKAKAVQLSAVLTESVNNVYDPVKHSADAIIVTAPANERRRAFISTVASFVAKDGSLLEQKLIEAESSNPDFQFLSHGDGGDDERMAEHIYYRWRVYSFCQGDGDNSWTKEPFIMFEPRGRWWIPPPLNLEAARKEEEAEKRREKERLVAQEERRKEFTTGREMDRARFGRGELKLNDWERETFTDLLRQKLCATQESICTAMSFAFEKSGAAREISEMLKVSLLEQDGGISADTRIARLFLLSDILFNSQQPGVRNAFQYRDAIEKMSPEVFESLGRHGNGRAGRMTMNKLRKAVSSVLSAWVNWSVFDSSYIDELECKFEGRKLPVAKVFEEEEEIREESNEGSESKDIDSSDSNQVEEAELLESKVSTIPRGGGFVTIAKQEENNLNGASVDEHLNSEALDEDIDGEPLSDADLDGEPLSDDDLDGEALDDDELPPDAAT